MTLTSFTKHLNLVSQKQTGKPFTTSDVQSYIRRGHLPEYLGGFGIVLNQEIEGVKLYNLISK